MCSKQSSRVGFGRGSVCALVVIITGGGVGGGGVGSGVGVRIFTTGAPLTEEIDSSFL